MQDFIQFKVFIAEDLLVIFYIIMAISLPFVIWFWLSWMLRRYAVFLRLYKSTKRSLIVSFIVWIVRRVKFFQSKVDEQLSWKSLSTSQKLKFIAVFLAIVIFSELFLRLMFEYLIAYMQMHEWMDLIRKDL